MKFENGHPIGKRKDYYTNGSVKSITTYSQVFKKGDLIHNQSLTTR